MAASPRAWLGVAGLLAFATFVLPRVVPAFTATYERAREAFRNAGETQDETLARFRSPEYVAALQRVKDTIPRDAAYYIVPPDGEDWNLVFVRFDLAPRRAQRLGPEPSADAPKWVVLARIEAPGPRVVETAEYLRAEAGE